jgi:hypothetical protein
MKQGLSLSCFAQWKELVKNQLLYTIHPQEWNGSGSDYRKSPTAEREDCNQLQRAWNCRGKESWTN